jgi:polygalacturonase
MRTLASLHHRQAVDWSSRPFYGLGKPLPAYVPQRVARVKPPRFPGRSFLITDYGAVDDGATDCTQSVRSAIEHCHKAGGGHVVVSDGTYLTGAIHLRSNVDLHLLKGATLKFSTDPAAYLPVVFTRWQGIELMNYSAFIYAYEQENIGVTGEGTLDGRDDNAHWWPWAGATKFGWLRPGIASRRCHRKLHARHGRRLHRYLSRAKCRRPRGERAERGHRDSSVQFR